MPIADLDFMDMGFDRLSAQASDTANGLIAKAILYAKGP
jgi:hypothetical protein